MRKGLLLAIIWIMSICIMPGSAGAERIPFTDVPEDHWAIKSIDWGIERGAISGYVDGSFKPNQYVTEAEFLRMLLSAYKRQATGTKSDHWAGKYYDYARMKHWTLAGLSDASAMDKPISRGNTAIILNNALGIDPSSVRAAIEKLYELDLSKGKTEKTVVGFQANMFLTRAEAIVFIRNFADRYAEIKAVTPMVRETSAEVKNKLTIKGITNAIQKATESKNYTMTTSNITVIGKETETVVPNAKAIYVYRMDDPEGNSSAKTRLLYIIVDENPGSRTVRFELSNLNGAKNDSLELVYDMLKELAVTGLVPSAELFTILTDNREAYVGGIYLRSIENPDGSYPIFNPDRIVSETIGSIEIVQ